MVTIAKFQSPDEAQLARMKLEGSGIEAYVADELMVTMNWFYSNAIGGIRLQVHDEDKDRAFEILNLVPTDEGLINCPNCGSQRISHRKMSALSVLSFFIGMFIPLASTKLDCLDCRQTFKYKKSD